MYVLETIWDKENIVYNIKLNRKIITKEKKNSTKARKPVIVEDIEEALSSKVKTDVFDWNRCIEGNINDKYQLRCVFFEVKFFPKALYLRRRINQTIWFFVTLSTPRILLSLSFVFSCFLRSIKELGVSQRNITLE